MKTPRFSVKEEVLEALNAHLDLHRNNALRASVITLLIQAVDRTPESYLRKFAGVGK